MLRYSYRLLYLCVTLALFGSSATMAQTATGFPRAYLGLGAGIGNVSLPSSIGSVGATTVTTQSGKNNSLAPKLYAGYRADSTWGIELGYQNFGSKHEQNLSTPGGAATGNMKLSSFYAAATATFSPASNVSLFAKLGLAKNFLVVNAVCVGATCTSSRGATSHRWTLAPGIGAEYAVGPEWGVRLDYDDYGKISADDVLSTSNSGAIRAKAWTVSAKRNF
jgi:hypothetical protein